MDAEAILEAVALVDKEGAPSTDFVCRDGDRIVARGLCVAAVREYLTANGYPFNEHTEGDRVVFEVWP